VRDLTALSQWLGRLGLPRDVTQKLIRQRTALTAIFIRGLTVLSGLAVTMLLSHKFGAMANGYYGLIVQTAALLGALFILGTDLALIRYFAPATASGLALDRVSTLSLLFTPLPGSLLAALVFTIGGGACWHLVFGAAAPISALWMLITVTAARAISRQAGAILRSQKLYTVGQLVDALAVPLAMCIFLAFTNIKSVDHVVLILTLASVVTMSVGIAIILPMTRSGGCRHIVDQKSVYKTGLPLLGASVGILFVDWYGLAIAGSRLSAVDAGIYRVAWQAASVLGIISTGIFSTFATRMSIAFANNDYRQLRALIRTAGKLSAFFGVPAGIVLIVFAEPLLAFVGPEFPAAANVLRVLCLGQLFAVIAGPSGLALAMTGNEKTNLVYTITGAVLLLIIAPIAAAQWGLEGLAAAVTGNIIFRNIAALWAIRRVIRLNIVQS
jgi:O-antigen/teichoic acid export membrane protein